MALGISMTTVVPLAPVDLRSQTNTEPQLFAEGVVSTGDNEFSISFTPDGEMVFWSISAPDRIKHPLVILMARRDGDAWGMPEVASFSGGLFSDADPFVVPDGKALIYMSRRPVSGDTPMERFDLWVVERNGEGWGEPRNVGPPVNTADDELFPTTTADGTLYYSSGYEGDTIDRGGRGGADLYRARWVGDRYSAPENLGDLINTEHSESNVYVAPDESFIVFASNRPGGLGGQDLYVSHNRDGAWTQPRNLGEFVNSPNDEYAPALSADGVRLYFTSRRPLFGPIAPETRLNYMTLVERIRGPGNGNADVYWVSADVLRAGP